MPLRLEIKKKFMQRSDSVKSVYLHPTEPWILVSLYSGTVYIFNYHSRVNALVIIRALSILVLGLLWNGRVLTVCHHFRQWQSLFKSPNYQSAEQNLLHLSNGWLLELMTCLSMCTITIPRTKSRHMKHIQVTSDVWLSIQLFHMFCHHLTICLLNYGTGKRDGCVLKYLRDILTT